MPRVNYVASATDQYGVGVTGAAVTVRPRYPATPVLAYADSTTSTPLATPILTLGGLASFWLDDNVGYNITISGGGLQPFTHTYDAITAESMNQLRAAIGLTTPAPAAPTNTTWPYWLDIGEEIIPRYMPNNTGLAFTSGQLRLSYFTARKTETITQIRMHSGNTVAGATPTVARMGVYQEDPTTKDLTLISNTQHDSSLFSVSTTPYVRTLTTPFNKVAGQRYASGCLIVSTQTMPTVISVGFNSIDAAISPRIAGFWAGQADLPQTVTNANIGSAGSSIQTMFLP